MAEVIVILDDSSEAQSNIQCGVQEMKTSDLNTLVTDSVETCDKKSKRTAIQSILPSMASHVTAGVKRKSTDLSGNTAKLLKAKSPPVKPVKQCERSNPCDEEADDQVTSSSELLEEHRLQAMSNRGKFMSLDKFFHRQSVEEVSTSGTKELLLPETETSGADINNDVVLSSGNSNVFDMLAFNKLPNLPNVSSVEDKPLAKPSGKKIENIANLLAKAKPKKNLPNLIENCDSKAQSDNKLLLKIVGVGNSDNVATDSEDTSACVNAGATVSTAIVEEHNSSSVADDSAVMETSVTLDTSVNLDESNVKDSDSNTSATKTPNNKTPKPRVKVSASSKAEREALRKKKEEEREKLRLEQQQKKEEKERLKLEEKQKKEMEKQKREQEKQKREQEKEEEKRKREEEKARKDEDKKKKLEQIEAERKKKEDEKKKKEEEQQKLEDLKLKKQQAFQSFFIKGSKTPVPKPAVSTERFMAFELKANMKLAPQCRVNVDSLPDRMAHLDKLLPAQDTSVLYVDELRGKSRTPGSCKSTWPMTRDDGDVSIVEEGRDKRWMRVKVLLFDENYRPPYRGTWRRRSNAVSGRRPFAKEAVFDYTVDSDEEWEEEEPGESISHSEGEDEEEGGGAAVADDDEDDDGFFVPHGYLSEGEGCNDEDEQVTPEMQKAHQLAKVRAWDAEHEGSKCTSLKPVTIGCCWAADKIPEHLMAKLVEFQIQLLCGGPIELLSSAPAAATESATRSTHTSNYNRQEVPEDAYPDLIRLVHGNSSGIVKLIAEFKQFWLQKTTAAAASTSPSPAQDGKLEIPAVETTTAAQSTPATESETPRPRGFISKRQLDLAIHNIATYEKRADRKTCWYVKTPILQKYNLADLPVPTQWVWLTRPDQQQRSVSETAAAAAAAEGNSTISMETGCLDTPKSGVKRSLDAGLVGESSPGNDIDASALPRKHAKMPPSTKSGKGKLWRMLREDGSVKKNKQCTVQETSPASLKRETKAAAANDCITLNTEKIEMEVVTGELQQINGADKRSPLSGLNANFAASKKQKKSSPNPDNKVKVAGKKPGAAAQQSALCAINKAIENSAITAAFPVVMETVTSSASVCSANSETVESETDTKT